MDATDDRLPELAEEMYRTEHGPWVGEALQDLLSFDEVKKVLADEFLDELDNDDRHTYRGEGKG